MKQLKGPVWQPVLRTVFYFLKRKKEKLCLIIINYFLFFVLIMKNKVFSNNISYLFSIVVTL